MSTLLWMDAAGSLGEFEELSAERCQHPAPPNDSGNATVDRNGHIVNTGVFEANEMAERDAPLVMLEQIRARNKQLWEATRHTTQRIS